MGEIADDIIEGYLDRAMFTGRSRGRRRTPQSGTGDYMWRSSEGIVSMYEMDPMHLANAIEVCVYNGNSGKAKQLREVLAEKFAAG